MAVLLLLLAATAQDPPFDERRVLELISECSSDVAEDRERAAKALREMGPAVLPLLKRAFATLQGAEPRRQMMRVIHDLSTPVEWARGFVEEDTDGRDRGLEQSLRERYLDPVKAGQVMAEIVRHPAATFNQRRYAIDLARRFRLPGMWPAILEVLVREEGDPSQTFLLKMFRPPEEALPELLKLLPKARGGALAGAFLDAILRLKASAADLESCVDALLREGAQEARTHVLTRLRQGLQPVTVPALLAWWRRHVDARPYLADAIARHPSGLDPGSVVSLLESSAQEEVFLALDAVEWRRMEDADRLLLGAWEARPGLRSRIVRTIRSNFGDAEIRAWFGLEKLRRVLVSVAVDLRLASAEPEILACLDSRDPAVRRGAASATAALGLQAAGDRLTALLRDRDGAVRCEALRALATLRRSRATDAVLDQLGSSDPDLQAAAAEVLPMVDANRALDALATEESMRHPFRRHALAVLIVAGGPAALERALARLKPGAVLPDLLARVRLLRELGHLPVLDARQRE